MNFPKRTPWVIGAVVLVVIVLVVIGKMSQKYRSEDSRDLSVESVAPTTGMSYGDQNAGGFGGYFPTGKMSAAVDKTGIVFSSTKGLQTQEGQQRLIIKTGDMSVVVKDVKDSVAKIELYATKNGGFVVRSSVNQSDIAPYAVVTIRIPSKLLDAGVAELQKLGQVVSTNINGDDFTEEYVDSKSRLKNLNASEEQLLTIMKRAGDISDVLAVQQQLTATRSQIEQLQGRIKYLEESAALSTLTVSLSTDPSALPVASQPGDEWKPVAVVKEALRNLLDVGTNVADAVIWVVIFIPLWLVIGLVGWVVWSVIRRYRS